MTATISRANLHAEREKLRNECGLDAYHQPAEVWLEMAVAAHALGHAQMAKDYERAMEISNLRYGAPS